MDARNHYLEMEVLTAPPHKLHLMLIEAAIHALQRAAQHWSDGRQAEGSESLLKAQEIVGEMLAGLNRQAQPELTSKIAAVYLFVYRALVEAGRSRQPEQLAEALRILNIERETWQTVCQRYVPAAGPAPAPNPGFPISAMPGDSAAIGGGFCLEA